MLWLIIPALILLALVVKPLRLALAPVVKFSLLAALMGFFTAMIALELTVTRIKALFISLAKISRLKTSETIA